MNIFIGQYSSDIDPLNQMQRYKFFWEISDIRGKKINCAMPNAISLFLQKIYYQHPRVANEPAL